MTKEQYDHLTTLTEEQLEVVGMYQGWYNRFKKAAGITAKDSLRFLPATLAAVGFVTSPNEMAITAGIENNPVDLSGLEHF